MPTFSEFRGNVLRFLERCAVSDGVADEVASDAAGATRVFGPVAERCVKPPLARREVKLMLEQRMRRDAWAFASTPGGCESIERGHSVVEALFLFGELGRLTERNRSAWVAYFNQYQDRETGYDLGPYVPPPEHRSWSDPRVNDHP